MSENDIETYGGDLAALGRDRNRLRSENAQLSRDLKLEKARHAETSEKWSKNIQQLRADNARLKSAEQVLDRRLSVDRIPDALEDFASTLLFWCRTNSGFKKLVQDLLDHQVECWERGRNKKPLIDIKKGDEEQENQTESPTQLSTTNETPLA